VVQGVTVPNLVALGQTTWAYVEAPQYFGNAGTRPLVSVTMPNLIFLGHAFGPDPSG